MKFKLLPQFNFIFLVIYIFLYATVAAQTEASKEKSIIPFRLTSFNNIVIKAVLNKNDTVQLMLHTAASDVEITEESITKLKTIKFDGKADSVQSWGGNANSSDVSNNNTLTIENLSWSNIKIWTDQYSGQESDGKFGLNLFENKIIELDFDKNEMLVESELPIDIRQYEKFKLIVQDDELFIKAVCQIGENNFENDFLIHSGYSGGILLDDEFVSKNKIGQQIKITGEKKLQDAYGNIITTKKGILPIFKMGKQTLANVPVGFFEGALGNQKISIIGGDILKRFNWILDAKREYIYLKPNNLFKIGYTSI